MRAQTDSVPQQPDSVTLVRKQVVSRAHAKDHAQDTTIWQGMTLRLDVFNSVLEVARSKGELQSYEIGLNARLKQRFFPTAEMGYAFGSASRDGARWNGQGGFLRLGAEINGLKKHPENPNVLLVGVRVAGAYQQYGIEQTGLIDPTWEKPLSDHYPALEHLSRWDAWGEIVGGCQVQVAGGFVMGWYVRMKILMTRRVKENTILPTYIPGFGYRNDTNWGFTYFVGWKF